MTTSSVLCEQARLVCAGVQQLAQDTRLDLQQQKSRANSVFI
jgi:hypothetical protein